MAWVEVHTIMVIPVGEKISAPNRKIILRADKAVCNLVIATTGYVT